MNGIRTKADLLELSNYAAGMEEADFTPALRSKLIELKSPVLKVWEEEGL